MTTATKMIRDELLEVTGLERKAAESDIDFRDRLADNACSSNAKFDKLSSEAQKWTIAASNAYNDDKPIPEFPDENKAPDRPTRAARPTREPRAETVVSQPPPVKEEPKAEPKPAEPADAAEESVEPTKAARRSRTPRATEPASAPSATISAPASLEPAIKVEGGQAVLQTIREIICQFPDMTNAEVSAKLLECQIPHSPSSISLTANETRKTIQTLISQGTLKKYW